MGGPDLSLDAQRQRRNLDFLASGAEFDFGDAADCPLPPAELAALQADSPGVEAVVTGGLSAEVLKLRVGERLFAVKKARPQCRVRNVDGQTSFLNELQRHAELRALALPGVLKPVYGSLRHGLIVSPWIAGGNPQRFDQRQTAQLLESGCALVAAGFFEWDFSPGNLLDDGRRLWLFDFGYLYRFDPLSQYNSAGMGNDCPQFHLAERIISRHLSGQLLMLDDTEALPAFRDFIGLALPAYEGLQRQLRERGARAHVLSWLETIMAAWRAGLDGDLGPLFLQQCWQAHAHDLDDDLRGQSCTARTLRRAEWLAQTAEREHATLKHSGALPAALAQLDANALGAHYRGLGAQARAYLIA
ncbi:hypothetical protein [Roseateles violae]|uniref:Aminoglycoside phosphotransferase domain-containing protein n=1 Tax=Roseateles violae TaxID=3058042 RepID=A0ABT8DY58_9BURK|nr:hypothetical protein [Pelomonas sp. PFR6]MDN3921961.1 hypothetical protein [Pelomonas sp. PFR6]